MANFLLIIAFLLIGSIRSQAQLGAPFIQSFPPAAYQSNAYTSSPQNWGIVQDDRGIIYVSNTSGVLEYDGIAWHLVHGTDLDTRFYLAKNSEGKIYACNATTLGYLAPDGLGRMQFVSLLPFLNGKYPDLELKRTVAVGHDVYFSSENNIFRWDGKQFQVFESAAGITRIFASPDGLYVLDNAKGMGMLVRNSFKALPGGEQFKDLNVTALLPMPVTKASKQNFFVVTYEQGLYTYQDHVLRKLPAIPKEILENSTFLHGIMLADGTVALATKFGGVAIVNDEGEVQKIIDNEDGLNDNTVLSLYTDQEGAIWAALNKGISRISYPSPITYLNGKWGMEGIVLDILKKKNRLYAGTTSGLYMIDEEAPAPQFQKLPLLQREVWKMLDVGEDSLLVVCSSGVYMMSGRKMKQLSPTANEIVYKTIHQSLQNPAEYYVGFSEGIALLSHRDGRWKWEGSLPGVAHEVVHLAEDSSGMLWATCDNNISSVDISGGDGLKRTVRNMRPAPSLVDKLEKFQVSAVNGHIYFGTSKGIYSIQKKGTRYFLKPDATFGDQFADGSREAINLTEDRNGHIWVTSEFRTGLLKRKADNTYAWDTIPLSRVPRVAVWDIHTDAEGGVWLGTTDHIYRYTPFIPKNYGLRQQTVLRKVNLKGDSTVFFGAFADNGTATLKQSPRFELVLPHAIKSIRFEYTATSYDAPEQLLYSYILEGEDENWSGWTTETKKEFIGLDEGSYVFKVKSKNIYGTENLASAFAFESLPPFYRTWWAYGFYVLFYGFVIWGFIKIKHRHLIATKRSLEKLVHERTAQLEAEKKKSDDLLLNILPAETAEELKANGRARARSYESVTVLFTDFKDFTSISEHLTPEELVSVIDFYFCAFDRIISKYKIEKIKTIGDAYMCAGGMPDPEANTPADVVKAALEILQFVKSLNPDDKELKRHKFEIRAGIHTGPVVAGIVGTTKFAYDIWGDTVNTAARMESGGEVGKVNISGTTYEIIKDEFRCTYRGKVDAKNKGDIDMYFVEAYVGDTVLQ